MAVPFDQRPDLIWFDGKLVPTADCRISVLTHGLHYASAVFEGERAYGGEIFRSLEHSERLKRSAQIMDFEIPFTVPEIEAAKRLVIEKNNQKEAYVRAIAWRGSEQLGVSAQKNTIHLAIATWEWPSYFDPASVSRASGSISPNTAGPIRRRRRRSPRHRHFTPYARSQSTAPNAAALPTP